MPVDTQTLPGTITRGQGGEKVAGGWCLITYEMAGYRKPLPEWRGEMAVTSEERGAAISAGDDLYLELKPYGGVFEPWHGPVAIDAVEPDLDPAGRRLRLRSAGPMIRSLYDVDEEAVDETSANAETKEDAEPRE